MAIVRLNTEQITDWASFHRVCQEAFGFPDFYGANMNAWIDCLSSGLNNDDKMTRFNLAENEWLNIEILNTENFNSRLPEIFDTLIECVAFINNRYFEESEQAKIALIFL